MAPVPCHADHLSNLDVHIHSADFVHNHLTHHPCLQVALLLPVLLRHLQRFTVHTCHEFDSMLVSSALICTLNNILQTGAVEGLAFLSGAAIAHQRMTGRQVHFT